MQRREEDRARRPYGGERSERRVQEKCGKDESARRAEKHIKGVVLRVVKCIAQAAQSSQIL